MHRLLATLLIAASFAAVQGCDTAGDVSPVDSSLVYEQPDAKTQEFIQAAWKYARSEGIDRSDIKRNSGRLVRIDGQINAAFEFKSTKARIRDYDGSSKRYVVVGAAEQYGGPGVRIASVVYIDGEEADDEPGLLDRDDVFLLDAESDRSFVHWVDLDTYLDGDLTEFEYYYSHSPSAEPAAPGSAASPVSARSAPVYCWYIDYYVGGQLVRTETVSCWCEGSAISCGGGGGGGFGSGGGGDSDYEEDVNLDDAWGLSRSLTLTSTVQSVNIDFGACDIGDPTNIQLLASTFPPGSIQYKMDAYGSTGINELGPAGILARNFGEATTSVTGASPQGGSLDGRGGWNAFDDDIFFFDHDITNNATVSFSSAHTGYMEFNGVASRTIRETDRKDADYYRMSCLDVNGPMTWD
ncbi:hypothetical protein [Rubrivirga sp. IMCC43871]|uniref:hypothetical protein n=1 Tax=Rubrivirga sp. IMCC43871 TaxID=3391575 RepID=UPI00398F9708